MFWRKFKVCKGICGVVYIDVTKKLDCMLGRDGRHEVVRRVAKKLGIPVLTYSDVLKRRDVVGIIHSIGTYDFSRYEPLAIVYGCDKKDVKRVVEEVFKEMGIK